MFAVDSVSGDVLDPNGIIRLAVGIFTLIKSVVHISSMHIFTQDC